jgi:hypothetical protein
MKFELFLKRKVSLIWKKTKEEAVLYSEDLVGLGVIWKEFIFSK